MQNLPKIVVDRLKAAPSGLCHPEADVLTAFAEHSLPVRERAEVVDHLARCGPCREIVMLTMPAADEIQVAVRPSRGGWLTWPALRWGVAAAGVVIVAALGIVQHQRTKSSVAAFMPIESNNAVVSEPKADSKGQAQASGSSVAPSASNRARDKALASSESKSTVGLPAASGVAASRIAPSPTLPPILLLPPRGASGNLAAHGPAMPTQQQAQQLAQANATVGGPISHSSQMVAVQAASPALQTRTRQSSAESTQLEAQNQPAPAESLFANGELVRAKPAMKAEFGPQWMVTAVGGLQRSFDQGSSWQDVNVMANLISTANGRNVAALSAVAPAGAKQNAAGANSAQPDSTKLDSAKSNSANSNSANQNLYKKAASPRNAAPALTPVFRTVTANGGDVWAGGTIGSLYHSVDAGNHWTQVVPTTAAGAALTGDVIRVEFADAQHGTVATSTSETWTTGDGGQTWQKQ